MTRNLLFVALLGCGSSNLPSATAPDPLDLTAALAPGQARAGVVGDDRAFWGGISAEAERGDIKIYNHRVQFAIQAPREGHYYVPQGGHVVDADLVRPVGQPGRDLVDEWVGMAGLGRLMHATRVTVVDNGRDSNVAIVRAEGYASPLQLIEGAIEAHGELLPGLGLQLTHTYILPADSYLMEVRTEVTATDQVASFTPGDAIMGAAEAASWFGPITGYQGLDEQLRGWNGYLGNRNEAALGMFSIDGSGRGTAGLQTLADLIEMAASFESEPVTLQPGESMSWSRYYGIGPDFATLTDAWLEATGVATTTVSSQATAGGEPVAGARVPIWVDDVLYTLAITDQEGHWSANLPTGSDVRWQTDGRGPGLFWDLPDGAAPYGNYLTPSARSAALASLVDGAPPIPLAHGMGASDGDPDTLTPAAPLTVQVDDGAPFEVRLMRLDPEPSVDGTGIRGRPFGQTAAGWARDGQVDLWVEPGNYQVIAHRGPRYERYVADHLIEGETVIELSLPSAFEHPGWLVGDPHVHAAPSPDGFITMEHRVINMAAVGVQLHFGTDHDHVADYRPLLEPLGLTPWTHSVVATEMSPVLRGHLNLYPLSPRGDLPNGGGWAWWRTPIENTADQFEQLRTRHGGPLTPTDGFAIQVNHPTGMGLMDFAGWSPGQIDDPEGWSDDFDAMELLNGNSYADYLPIYFDLVNRGLHITPTGVSDSHKPFSGNPGLNVTYLGIGSSDPQDYTDDALREVFSAGRTIVSRGLFLDLSIEPGAVVTGPQSLEVSAHGASWAAPDRIRLYENGIEIAVVEDTTAVFDLSPSADATYAVSAEGDTSMAPLWSTTPWVMSAVIKVDVTGDGWTPPLPALVVAAE